MMRRLVESRERVATTIFMLGTVGASDRVLSRVHFAMFANRWADLSDRPDHLRAYCAGLERCGEPRRIVDLGTGTGSSAAAAAARFPSADVVGLDISRAMLRRARKLHTAPNLRFEHGSVLRLPFESGSIDVVTSLNALAELGELGRVLPQGGLVMSASSLFGLRGETSAWVGRWSDAGFERIDCAETQPGSWELYRRR